MKIYKPRICGKKSGVYKITIDSKWFYIGSSKHLCRRLSQWKNYILKNDGRIKNMKFVLNSNSDIKMEVLAYCLPDNEKLLENEYLKISFNNENCINRCPNAFTIRNRRMALGESRIIKKRGLVTPKKPIAKFSNDGVLIKVYKSIYAANNELKIKDCEIGKMLKGLRGQPKSYKLKEVSSNGYIIEPPIFIRKKRPLGIIPPTARKIIQSNDKGDIVNTYRSIKFAAEAMNCSKNAIWNVVAGYGNAKRVRGFYFRYA